jgi:hypothetical protein
VGHPPVEVKGAHPNVAGIGATLGGIAGFVMASFETIAAAPGSPFMRNMIGLGLATAPTTVPIIGGAIEGLTPGPTGSLTISSATRLTEQETSTGVRLASQTGTGLAESAHVGEEFVDAAGKSYDAMGGAKAFEHFGAGNNFFDSILSHVDKSVDIIAVNLREASKAQVGAIKNFVQTLMKVQQKKIVYIN